MLLYFVKTHFCTAVEMTVATTSEMIRVTNSCYLRPRGPSSVLRRMLLKRLFDGCRGNGSVLF